MSKTIDWNAIGKLPHAQKRGKYSSGKEMLAKAAQDHEIQQQRMEVLKKAEPGMKAVFNYRMINKQPMTVTKSFRYATQELQESTSGAYYRDSVAFVEAGTVLTPVAVDPNLQEFVFKSQFGNEVVINFADQKALYLNTDIYDLVFNHLKGE